MSIPNQKKVINLILGPNGEPLNQNANSNIQNNQTGNNQQNQPNAPSHQQKKTAYDDFIGLKCPEHQEEMAYVINLKPDSTDFERILCPRCQIKNHKDTDFHFCMKDIMTQDELYIDEWPYDPLGRRTKRMLKMSQVFISESQFDTFYEQFKSTLLEDLDIFRKDMKQKIADHQQVPQALREKLKDAYYAGYSLQSLREIINDYAGGVVEKQYLNDYLKTFWQSNYREQGKINCEKLIQQIDTIPSLIVEKRIFDNALQDIGDILTNIETTIFKNVYNDPKYSSTVQPPNLPNNSFLNNQSAMKSPGKVYYTQPLNPQSQQPIINNSSSHTLGQSNHYQNGDKWVFAKSLADDSLKIQELQRGVYFKHSGEPYSSQIIYSSEGFQQGQHGFSVVFAEFDSGNPQNVYIGIVKEENKDVNGYNQGYNISLFSNDGYGMRKVRQEFKDVVKKGTVIEVRLNLDSNQFSVYDADQKSIYKIDESISLTGDWRFYLYLLPKTANCRHEICLVDSF